VQQSSLTVVISYSVTAVVIRHVKRV